MGNVNRNNSQLAFASPTCYNAAKTGACSDNDCCSLYNDTHIFSTGVIVRVRRVEVLTMKAIISDKTIAIVLTKSQVENLIEFFELCFIDQIRNDTEIDNMDYMVDMINVYAKLKEANKESTND